MNQIRLIRLYSGDSIIGETAENAFSDEKTDYVEIKNPRSFRIIPVPGGITGSLTPVCAPFVSKRLSDALNVDKKQIFYYLDESELEKDLVNGYKSEVSGIKVPSAQETAAVNGGVII